LARIELVEESQVFHIEICLMDHFIDICVEFCYVKAKEVDAQAHGQPSHYSCTLREQFVALGHLNILGPHLIANEGLC
jgi:hypothetical protein